MAKVISKGSTPAGMHIPIMVDEILGFLRIEPGQTGLDATLGYGGHSGKMLEKLQGKGHLYALDVDPIESAKTEERLRKAGYGEDIFTVRHMNFRDIDQLSAEVGKFDFMMADLGVSSMQIDDPSRGFSYKNEGPLDLRLNPEKGVPAWEMLQGLTQPEVADMLFTNADEPYAEKLSRAIVKQNRSGHRIRTTTDLRAVIEGAMEKELKNVPAAEKKEEIKKTCQRVFQAVRIEVNGEYEALEALMSKLPGVMNPGGRIAVLTFHSGEDRIVKQAFREFCREGVYSEATREVIRPTAEECRRNSRAHSAKLRWAIVSSAEGESLR
ncbi:MAG: 16S rRNA (cytosine(1402)-N(4))-methyltransferase RsmH [Lachnospiraceae bacterium]